MGRERTLLPTSSPYPEKAVPLTSPYSPAESPSKVHTQGALPYLQSEHITNSSPSYMSILQQLGDQSIIIYQHYILNTLESKTAAWK